MKIIHNKNKLLKFIHNEKYLGFVPTMGAFHDGHISLIKKCIFTSKKSIVSIFINKPQFNNKTDFEKYPRTIQKDVSILKRLKVDYLYLPSFREIYPRGSNSNIKISKFKNQLCGKFRKGHFESVADVVDRLIKIIKPKKIYFGEKDMQQLKIIEHFIKNNHSKIKVISCKTIREKNGVAYSSRNKLLSKEDKKIASKVYQILLTNKKNLLQKKISLKNIQSKIYALGIKKIDYIEILNINKLIRPYKRGMKHRIFVAYYLKKVRLIDNI